MDAEDTQEYKTPVSHKDLITMVQSYLDTTRPNATEVERDRNYFDGDQISAKMLKALEERGQPPIYVNKIANIINGMFGVLDAASSDPEAFPRSVHSQDAADTVTKVLRYVSDKTDFKNKKRAVSENFLVEGSCAAIVEWDGRNIHVERIHWTDFVYDPISREHDFRDAKFLGVGKLMDVGDVKAAFPTYDAGTATTDDFLNFNDEDTKARYWLPQNRKLVRVVDLYYRDGHDWHRAVFTSGQILWSGESEYHDDEGRTICPIRAASYDITRFGDRYGAVRHMRPLQDEVNARRSRLLHLTNHRQLVQSEATVQPTAANVARQEAARADGVIPYGYEALPAPDLAQGQMLILQQSVADLDRMGPTPAVLGRLSGANESGRARQVLQSAGYTELARAFGRFEHLEMELYRTMWFVCREHMTAPQVIRIADDPRAVSFLTINEPVMGMVAHPVMDESGQPVIDPQTGRPALKLAVGQVGTQNSIAQLDMDIVLSTVPDQVTLAKEAFDTVMEFASAVKLDILDPRFELLIEMSAMPNKRELLERLEAFKTEQAQKQQPDPIAEQAKQLALAETQAGIEKDRAKALKDMTQAQVDQATMVRKNLGFE